MMRESPGTRSLNARGLSPFGPVRGRGVNAGIVVVARVCVLYKSGKGLLVDVFQHGTAIARLAEIAVDERVENRRVTRNESRVNDELAFVGAYDESKGLGGRDPVLITAVMSESRYFYPQFPCG
jgi:hypothetical protein